MADDRIVIQDLDPIGTTALTAVVPVMKDGVTFKMTMAQIQALLITGADNDAHALKDLSNTVGPRGKIAPVMLATTDYNDCLENGFFYIPPDAPNAPEPTNVYLLKVEKTPDTWCTQYARAYGADSSTDSKLYKRELNGVGVWGSWYRVRENEAELDARYIQQSKLGMEFITAGSVQSANTQVENDLGAGFKSFHMRLRNIRPTTNGNYASIQFRRSGSWVTAGSSYIWTVAYWGAPTAPTAWNDASGGGFSTAIVCTGGAGLTSDASASLLLDINPGSALQVPSLQSAWQSGNNGSRGHGAMTTLGRIDGVRFKFTAGDMDRLEYELYGLR